MDFKEFWNKLSVELRHAREFSTLTQQKILKVQMTCRDAVTILPGSTGIKGDIPMEPFHGMWDIMKDDIRSKRYVKETLRKLVFVFYLKNVHWKREVVP